MNPIFEKRIKVEGIVAGFLTWVLKNISRQQPATLQDGTIKIDTTVHVTLGFLIVTVTAAAMLLLIAYLRYWIR